MPDRRAHRGPHPADIEQFGADAYPRLAAATEDLSLLLTRGYAPASSLKLVGDRYALTARQRTAVARGASSDGACLRRAQTRVRPPQAAGSCLLVDGYNLLTTLEAALSGGVILRCRDGAFRDMASMHGTYRVVMETIPAFELAAQSIVKLGASACLWYFDRPVSNSGRLKSMLRRVCSEKGWNFDLELVPDPDRVLKSTPGIAITSDSEVLDHCAAWLNLADPLIREEIPGAWIVSLGGWDNHGPGE